MIVVKSILAWQWGGWAGENWAYSQNRGAGPLSPWLGSDNWGHQIGIGRGNAVGGAYPQNYGTAWGGLNGAIAAGALHGYGSAGAINAGSGRSTGGNRKGYSQR